MLFLLLEGAARPLPRPAKPDRGPLPPPSIPLRSFGFDPCKCGTLSRRDAIARAFAELWRSCLFTSLTTALGFGSLAVSGVAIVVELALFTALAIVLAFVCAMVVLPLLLDLGAERAVRETAWLERLVAVLVDRARCARAAAEHRRSRGGRPLLDRGPHGRHAASNERVVGRRRSTRPPADA
ncbi:MAG: MMPL family transporter [Sandaracinus sp.]|nr:MMPL family transporter [Sandaracinus sp.]